MVSISNRFWRFLVVNSLAVLETTKATRKSKSQVAVGNTTPDWPRKCDCGESFNTISDLRSHPDTYREVVKASSAVQRILACSDDVTAYKKAKGWNLPFNKILHQPKAVEEAEVAWGSNQKLEETTTPQKEMPKKPSEPKPAQEKPKRLRSLRESQTPVKAITMKSLITPDWPSKCACGEIFEAKEDLLTHPTAYRYERPTSSSELSRALLCSDEVMAYKKQNGIDAGMLMVATGQGDGLLSSAMREMTSLLTEAKLPLAWPKKCGCGTIFKEESDLRCHPDTYREVESKTSSAVQRILACSDDVTAYKKAKGWKSDSIVTIHNIDAIKAARGTKRQLEETQDETHKKPREMQTIQKKPSEVNTSESPSAVDWPNRCNCGAKFKTKADLLTHPTAYHYVRSKTTSVLHRVLFCSEEVLVYKSQMEKEASAANRTIVKQEEDVPVASQTQAGEVIDLTTPREKKVENPPWPTKCRCKTEFASEEDVLNHLTVYKFGTANVEEIRIRSSCSWDVVVFKKCRSADPGYRVQRTARYSYVGPSLITEESMKQCCCGATFETMKDIFEHDLVFESNHKWASHPCKVKTRLMCSSKIVAWKRERKAMGGYLVRYTTRPASPKDAKWPTECKCGAYFPNLESVLNHPVTYNSTETRIECSGEVMALKQDHDADVGNFVRRQNRPSRTCSVEIMDEALRKCDCGTRFKWNMDIVNHPSVFESGKMVCSDRIAAFKSKLRADSGTWHRPVSVQPPRKEKVKDAPIPTSVLEVVQPNEEDVVPEIPPPEEKDDIVLETPPPQEEDEVVPRTPTNSVDDIGMREWPHECDCDTGFSFPTLDSVLGHVEMRDRSGMSLCSPVMNAFKKKHGANPGFMVREDNHAADLVEDVEITDQRLRQCKCGSKFESLAEILFHPTMYAQYADGSNKTLMCSPDILKTKAIHNATPGYVVYNYTKEETEKPFEEETETSSSQVVEERKVAVPIARRPDTIRCGQCAEKGFKTPVELADHMTAHEKPLFECICNRHFINKQEAVAHTTVHSSRSNVMCEFTGCGKRFFSTIDLKHHISENHVLKNNNDAKFHCKWPGCGRDFLKVSIAKRHMKEHTNSMNFLCVCGQRLQTDRDVRQHLSDELHSIRHHKCVWPACGKYFCSSWELRHHLMTHSTLKSVGKSPLQADTTAFESWVTADKFIF